MITHTEFIATPSGMYEATRTGLEVGKGVFVKAKLNGQYVTDLTEVIEYAVNF
jgi:hypothetical protein